MTQNSTALVTAENLDIFTPSGRPLFRGLNVEIGYDQVAIIGRNGVGKSTLLRILAGEVDRPEVQLHTAARLVPQDLGSSSNSILAARSMLCQADLAEAALPFQLLTQDKCSPGEQRSLHLLAAKKAQPELLVLDEPTSDLDEEGVDWLVGWLSKWSRGLIVVSHNRNLLRHFDHFFVIAESGCKYLSGGLEKVEDYLELEEQRKQREYVSNLNALIQKEEKNERVNNRHDRKKNRGRLNELGRCTARIKLNEKRSYAQVKQGKRKKLWQQRITGARAWAAATRRALSVQLDLELIAPQQPTDSAAKIVEAIDVSAVIQGREIFSNVSICLQRSDRLVVSGRNGSGKTTLLSLLAGLQRPANGVVIGDFSRIGLIEQGAANWQSELGLMEHLQLANDSSLEKVAEILAAHRFPFALAERPLQSLSPGERVRAALICLFHRTPAVELLILDEPTVGLDFVGLAALRDALKSWPGALVIVSHDRDFIDSIDVNCQIKLD
ncbi:MAG: ATP-binding cassette domain-containing protein [Pirellulales bacterium]